MYLHLGYWVAHPNLPLIWNFSFLFFLNKNRQCIGKNNVGSECKLEQHRFTTEKGNGWQQ